jgi:hypothetical protein
MEACAFRLPVHSGLRASEATSRRVGLAAVYLCSYVCTCAYASLHDLCTLALACAGGKLCAQIRALHRVNFSRILSTTHDNVQLAQHGMFSTRLPSPQAHCSLLQDTVSNTARGTASNSEVGGKVNNFEHRGTRCSHSSNVTDRACSLSLTRPVVDPARTALAVRG